jgi:hypothetical protein
MKKNIFFAGISALMLILCLALIACDTGGGGGGPPPDPVVVFQNTILGLDQSDPERTTIVGYGTQLGFDPDPRDWSYAEWRSLYTITEEIDPADDYILVWGAFYASVSEVEAVIDREGWTVTEPGAPNQAYATGNDATNIYIYCINNISFVNGGADSGTYQEMLDYTHDGIGLPTGQNSLRSALASESSNVPIAGIFLNPHGEVTVFYVVAAP